MDPQQRLLLEEGYAAAHRASLRRSDLLGANVGVCIGMMNTDFARAESEGVYAATGSQVSVASGRLAFALALCGPCTSVDTACSSALVALDIAARNVHTAACGSAICAAVNLILDSTVYRHFVGAGMLSNDGRCKTFDTRAK